MKLFVGVATYSNPSMRFAAALIKLAKHRTIDVCFNIGLCYVGKARNELAMDFLASDCDTFLQIDDDILFTPENVDRITSHDLPIVGGAYFKKQLTKAVVAERLEGAPRDADERGLLQAKYLGTGFLCVKREVFEQMVARHQDKGWFWYEDEETGQLRYDFFTHGVHPQLHRWLGEDWYFCQRANDLGYVLYLDTKCIVGHIGQMVFPLPDMSGLQFSEPDLNIIRKSNQILPDLPRSSRSVEK
jgi:hypothetical protein